MDEPLYCWSVLLAEGKLACRFYRDVSFPALPDFSTKMFAWTSWPCAGLKVVQAGILYSYGGHFPEERRTSATREVSPRWACRNDPGF